MGPGRNPPLSSEQVPKSVKKRRLCKKAFRTFKRVTGRSPPLSSEQVPKSVKKRRLCKKAF